MIFFTLTHHMTSSKLPIPSLLSFIEMGEATVEPVLSLLVQADALLAKSAHESGMNVWFQVHQSLEKDGISGAIPDDQAHEFLIGESTH